MGNLTPVKSFGTWLATGDDVPTESNAGGTADYGPLATRVTMPSGRHNGLGVLIVPPVGYEYVSSFRALHVLAQELAARGCVVARVDEFGNGDSAGRAGEVTSHKAWVNVVPEGAAYLRRAGAREVVVLGCRIGATLALLAAPSVGAIAVAALAPILSGRQYGRELRMMRFEHDQADVGVIVGGSEFSEPLLTDLASLDMAHHIPHGIPCLVVARPSTSNRENAFAEELRASGTEVEVRQSSALRDFLDVAAEEATIDPTFTAETSEWICRWAPGGTEIVEAEDGIGTGGLDRDAALLRWGGSRLRETFVTIGHEQLTGVLTAPEELTVPSGDLVVFLSSGSEPHTGPGRAWVEFARDLATHGVSALRVDMRGWGDSPDGPDGCFSPSRPYDPHALSDVRTIVSWHCQEGWDRVVLSGLCAGASVALEVARDTKFGGVLALDQHFQHRDGEPFFFNTAAAWAYRQDEFAEIAREARAGRWDKEDREGLRPPAARWLDALVENEVPIALIFSGDDTGLEFLTNRLALRLTAAQESPYVRMHVIAELDHPLFRTWLRPKVLGIFLDELERWSQVR